MPAYIDTPIAETRPLPFPGHIEYARERISAGYLARVGQPQIATASWTGAFNGTRDLGIIYGGGNMAYGQNAANIAAWLVLVNAALTGIATVTEAAGVITVTTVANAPLTLAPFAPNDPDLSLGVFTVTQQAITNGVIRSGMGVVWADRLLHTVQAPLPDSTLEDYVGTVDRACLPADDICIRWAGARETAYDGLPLLLVRYGSPYLRGQVPAAPAVPVAITAAQSVYLGRISGEAGYYFGADDGGNTRLRIPQAQFMGPGTPGEYRGLRSYFR
jgi:hypothetical protein